MTHEIKVGGFWDGAIFLIETNYELDSDEKIVCPHVKDGKVPAMVIASNEGGFNSTGVCLHCIIQAAKENNLV